jgi:transcriptional regulator with XRE-family HTH domain
MMKEESNKTAGELVREARERHDLSIAKLAALADVDPRWLSRFEQGRYRNPDPRHMQRLAEALDLEPIALLTAADYVEGLPGFGPYLRTKYELPAEAVAQLEAHFELIADKYDAERGGSDEQQRHLPAA